MTLDDFGDIAGSQAWISVEPVEKGWSGDRKYRIETADGRRLLLRVAEISACERKQAEYDAMRMLDGCDILMSRPVDFGVCGGGSLVFVLLTWLDGADARTAVPLLPALEQHRLGRAAGQALRRLHGYSAPAHADDWAVRFNAKIDRNTGMFVACPVKPAKAERLLGYIDANRHLLEGRPQTFHHGDYHIGNMILTAQHQIGIIDFNRCDHGDPWEEFNRIVWCAESSGAFAAGRIDGYFDGNPPPEFFRLMALYICSNTLGSIPWAVRFGQREVDTMLSQAERVLRWYDDFRAFIPSWYLEHRAGRAEVGTGGPGSAAAPG